VQCSMRGNKLAIFKEASEKNVSYTKEKSIFFIFLEKIKLLRARLLVRNVTSDCESLIVSYVKSQHFRNFLIFSIIFSKTRTNHHTSEECQIFKDNRDLLTENRIDAAGILLVLRLWIIKHKNPAVWEKIDHMEAHLDKRIGTSVWKDRKVNVVDVSFT